MNREERERLVDSALDWALGPRLVEPREGLEQRIVANLATAPQPRLWWRWMWVPALAAAAVLALVIGMRVMRREAPAQQQAQKTVEAPKPEIAVKQSPSVPQPMQRRQAAVHIAPKTANAPKTQIAVAQRQELPRQAVFPSPTPLTEQERLLLALVNRQRPQAEQIAAEQQAQRESFQKYLETGEAPVPPPTPAQPMR